MMRSKNRGVAPLLVMLAVLASAVGCQSMSPEEDAFGRARIAHIDKRFAKAKLLYREAISIRPDAGELYYNRGLIRMEEGEPTRAVVDFKSAVQMYKAHFEDAESDAERAVLLEDVQEKLVEAYHALANAYFRKAEPDVNSSLEFLEHARDTGPRSDKLKADIYYNLGVSYEILDRVDDAITAYDEAIRTLTKNGKPHINLAYINLDDGRIDDARAAASRAQQLGFNDPDLVARLAWWDGWSEFLGRDTGVQFTHPPAWISGDDPSVAAGELIVLTDIVGVCTSLRGAVMQVSGPDRNNTSDNLEDVSEEQLTSILSNYVRAIMEQVEGRAWGQRQDLLDEDAELPEDDMGGMEEPELSFGPLSKISAFALDSGASAVHGVQTHSDGSMPTYLDWYFVLGKDRSWIILTTNAEEDARTGYALNEIVKSFVAVEVR